MKSDSLFYTLFRHLPEILFTLVGKNVSEPHQYTFHSVEVKALSFRLDGILALPNFREEFFFVEVQYRKDTDFYARLFAEIMLFLRQYKPEGDWQAVVIFAKRSSDPHIPKHYREFADSGRVRIIYLDELPSEILRNYPMNILHLIELPADMPTLVRASKNVIQTIKQALPPSETQEAIIDLVISVFSAKFPTLTLQEIDTMLREPLWSDFQKSRVYQDILAEGREQGLQQGLQDNIQKIRQEKESIARKLLAFGLSIEQIAEATGLTAAEIQRLQKNKRSKKPPTQPS